MSATTWVQQVKTLTYNNVISTTTSVDIIMSEKYKNEQGSLKLGDILEVSLESNEMGEKYYPVKKGEIRCGYLKNEHADKINAFPFKMKVIDKKYFKGKYLIKLDI